jgi:hypothetical protein
VLSQSEEDANEFAEIDMWTRLMSLWQGDEAEANFGRGKDGFWGEMVVVVSELMLLSFAHKASSG